jgi:hypothetical protein
MRPQYRNIHTGVITKISKVETIPKAWVQGEKALSTTVYTLSNDSRWNMKIFHQHWEALHPFYNEPFTARNYV